MYFTCDVGVAKHQDFKLYEAEKPNDTDVDDVLEKLKSNDASLKEINLNNIKVIHIRSWVWHNR